MSDPLIIAGREFRSRLIVGTGKYKSFQETARALEASGTDMVTVAVRRVNLDRSKESLLDYLDPKKYFLLPNTAGCYTADEAIRAARLGREVGLSDWVKLEVIGDQATLYPDVQATLEATRVLVKEGFTVLPYTSAAMLSPLLNSCYGCHSGSHPKSGLRLDAKSSSAERRHRWTRHRPRRQQSEPNDASRRRSRGGELENAAWATRRSPPTNRGLAPMDRFGAPFGPPTRHCLR